MTLVQAVQQQADTQTLATEAVRLHRRYMTEFVEAYGLCPWAKEARERGHVRHHVSSDASPNVAAVADGCKHWLTDPRAEVCFVLLPGFAGDAGAFGRWVDALRGTRLSETYALAPFFPRFDQDTAISMMDTLRQTPDPTVQLVQHAALANIRSSEAPKYVDPMDCEALLASSRRTPVDVHATVLKQNAERVRATGMFTIRATLEAIKKDRDQAYAGLRTVLG